MNLTIPFTKEIKFSTNINEIVSISLEHDYTLNEGEILGNFTVTGDYKSHAISVNKEHFEYVLPFSVSLPEAILEDSLEFSIEDFTYEVMDKDTLKVNIEYKIQAEKAEEAEVEEVEEEDLFQRVDDVEPLEEMLDQAIADVEESSERLEEETNLDNTERHESEDTVVNTGISATDSFVTYRIHVMQENDTVESICQKYKISELVLQDYNDVSKISAGDKVIIPDVNE